MSRIRGNLAAAMRRLRVALIALFLAVACAQPTATSSTTPTPAPADTQSLTPVFGSYRADDGRVFVIARLGWFFDVRDATYPTIYNGAAPNHFSIGPAFAIPLPKYADLTFDGTTLTVATARATVSARRVQHKQADVTIPADGAMLAGAITEPTGSGTHPGIVIVHGSEQGERHFYDIWVGIYAGLGLTVLTYDKRGIGSSTGRYPGEFPTDESLRIYADDAAASLDFLSRWPGVDPKRVGFHGGSQGGGRCRWQSTDTASPRSRSSFRPRLPRWDRPIDGRTSAGAALTPQPRRRRRWTPRSAPIIPATTRHPRSPRCRSRRSGCWAATLGRCRPVFARRSWPASTSPTSRSR